MNAIMNFQSSNYKYYMIDIDGCKFQNINIHQFVSVPQALLPNPINPNDIDNDIISMVYDERLSELSKQELKNLVYHDKNINYQSGYLILAKYPEKGYQYFHLKLEYFYIKLDESDKNAFWYNDESLFDIYHPNRRYHGFYKYYCNTRDMLNTLNREYYSELDISPQDYKIIHEKINKK